MQPEEMTGLIQQGEGQTIEFKESFAEERDAIVALCAFTHADGGTVFFGVRNDGSICGVSLGSNTLENFANHVRANTEPPLTPRIYPCTIEGKDVIGVIVDKLPANEVCYAYNIPYIRVGKSNQVMPPNQVKNRFLAGIKSMAYSGKAKELIEAVPPLSIQEPSIQSEIKIEAKPPSEYHEVTAIDLVKAGFRRDRVHMILGTQDEAFKKKNYRLAKFLNSYVDQKWDNVPRTWRTLIAGFPIIGQDVGSPSLNDLAELAKKLHPYLSRELRRTYHKGLPPIIMGILAEIQAFLQDAATAGGLPLAITVGPPASWKDWLPWLWERERSFKIDDSLMQGKWVYMFPDEVIKYNIDISKTWAGLLYDIISRLPDPDRQKGQLLRKYDLTLLTYIWCATAPQDFKPALTDIIRKPVSSSDHTLAGVYKAMKEHF